MQKKWVIGLIIALFAGLFTFYVLSKQNEDLNEWDELSKSNDYLAELSDTFAKTNDTNEKFKKILEEIEDTDKSKHTIKKLEELGVEYQKIRKEILMINNKDVSDEVLTVHLNNLKTAMIDYLTLQDKRVKEYALYAENKDDMSIEKAGRLEMELEDKIEEFSELHKKIGEHFKK